ncbi:MAG: glycerophosphodiester phosphodiesterase [Caulobacter sp.]|nr:glycerophosphodiester phosphodiesterase [Caulobacter sp.]
MFDEEHRRRLSRRAVAAAALAIPALASAKPRTPMRPPITPPRRPIVIAHRGASGERPEETRAAYELAIDQGCDFIEPDLVATKDGKLVCRHENNVAETTDVAARPEFAARQTTKMIDGASLTGWFTEDFTLAELKTLRARERLPALRPASAAHDGQEPILTFAEVCAIAREGTKRTGRVIGVYPEMKHPTHFAGLGLGLEQRLLEALKAEGLNSAGAPVFVQCFEVGALAWFRTRSPVRLVQLVSGEGGPADKPGVSYAQMTTPAGLKAISAYADGLGPDKAQVIVARGGALVATPLVADAHAAGLVVHPWTVRAENLFLPPHLWVGTDPKARGHVEAVYAALFAAGVDGLFSDFPGLAAEARAALG